MELVIESGVFAMLVLELVKRLVHLKYKDFQFTDKMYTVILPVLAYASVPVLAFLGYTNYTMPTDLAMFAQELVRITIGALLAVFVYNNTLKTGQDVVVVPAE